MEVQTKAKYYLQRIKIKKLKNFHVFDLYSAVSVIFVLPTFLIAIDNNTAISCDTRNAILDWFCIIIYILKCVWIYKTTFLLNAHEVMIHTACDVIEETWVIVI